MKDKISNNKFVILIVLIFSSLIVYKMSSAFYSLLYNNMISWNNPGYNPLNLTRIESDYNRRLFNDILKYKSIEEIDKIINNCETGSRQQSIENYQDCQIVLYNEIFEEYKNIFNTEKLLRNSFVFNRSVITTGIIVLLLYLYLKQGPRGKTLIPVIISSWLTYVVSTHFYKLFYSTVFHYPTKPDNTKNLYDLSSQYVFSGDEKIGKFALEKIIKEQEKVAQNCQAQAQRLREQVDSYQEYHYYNDQVYQAYQEQYEHSNECYQKNEQTKKTYEDYRSAIVQHEKNLEIFAFVMGITTTGTTNFFLYRFLRKKSQDEQFSSIDDNYQNQTHYYNYSSNQPKGLSFEEWLNQNPALQYFSEQQQRQAYQNYLSSLEGNQYS